LISIDNTEDEIKAHYRKPDGILKSWVRITDQYMGRRSDGVVLLTFCAQCNRNYVKAQVGPRGPLPPRCHECHPRQEVKKAEQIIDCALCGDPFERGNTRETRGLKYCSAECQVVGRRAKRKAYDAQISDEQRRRYNGAKVLKDRQKKAGLIDEGPQRCIHCGLPVDPRYLSKHGWYENGTNVHMAAGSAPEDDVFDGKSCMYFVKQTQHDLVVKGLEE
jgi:hypothetical protein